MKHITIKQIHTKLKEGDERLYDRRFSTARENDVNNYSVHLEDTGMHPLLPKFSLKELADLSQENMKSYDKIMVDIKSARDNDSRLSGTSDGGGFLLEEDSWDVAGDSEDIGARIEELKARLGFKYKERIDSKSIDNVIPHEIIEEIGRLELRRAGTWDVKTKLNDDKFIMQNEITLLQDAYETNKHIEDFEANNQTRKDKPYKYRTRTLGGIMELIATDNNTDKSNREQIYSVTTGMRPVSDAYHLWNGFQIFDLDLKNSPTPHDPADIKQRLFNDLSHYNWFLGVGLSTSGNGIHIYTKVARPHQYYLTPEDNESLLKYWYRTSYVQKFSIIRYLLGDVYNLELKLDDPKHAVIDFSMARIQQGAKVTYDPNFMINLGFEDLQLQFGFHIPPTEGLSLTDWLLHPSVINNTKIANWDREYSIAVDRIEGNATYGEFKELDVSTDLVFDQNIKIEDIKPYDGEIYYALRWNVVNTIAAIYGESGREMAHYILKSEFCKNETEIQGMFNTAITSNKAFTKWGIQILQASGVGISYTDEGEDKLNDELAGELKALLQSASKNVVIDHSNNILLDSNQYLGDISDDLLNKMVQNKVNLVISPPGTGKTEWIKGLVRKGKRVCLVLPYTSIIQAKVEKDPEFTNMFDCFYGYTNTDLIVGARSAVMTIDKFSNIETDKLLHSFDYIAIDESHLMFTSSFRLKAMSNALKKVKELTKTNMMSFGLAKTILMTGTPTGEIPYFEFYKNLNMFNVFKNENRSKNVTFKICNTVDEQLCQIAIHIADSLGSGKKVIFPTNKGDNQAIKLVGMIEYILKRSIKWGYYKKSNQGDELSTAINDDATMAGYELLLASNYLSVGIDIKDIQDFECIYDNSFAAYEIEQFNCRLREVNISSTVYLSCHTPSGDVSPTIMNVESFSLEMNRVDRDLLRDHIDIAQTKLNLSANYDPITGRIFTPGLDIENGQVVFKLEEHELVKFEERFLKVYKSPYFVARSLAEFGYTINVEIADKPSLDEEAIIAAGMELAKMDSIYQNNLTIESIKWLLINSRFVNKVGVTYENLPKAIFDNNIQVKQDNTLTEEIAVVQEDFLGAVTGISALSYRRFTEAIPVAIRLLSLYCADTSIFILESCISDTGKLNKSELERYMNLIQLIRHSERDDISDNFFTLIEDIYEIVTMFVDDPEYTIEESILSANIDALTLKYLDSLQLNLRTDLMRMKYRDEVNRIVSILTKKRRKNKEVILEFRILPTPDNETRQKQHVYATILNKIFELNDSKIEEIHRVKLKHIDETLVVTKQTEKLRNIDTTKVNYTISL